MKSSLFFLLTFMALSQLKAQNSTPVLQQAKNDSIIEFKETVHDFGSIPQGKPVYYVFELKNNSTEPVKLDNVQASCGCTTPEWRKEAIPPSSWDKIKVGYNAANEGNFEKYITITYNGNQTKQIKIRGNVWKAPSGSAPANASVQFLKTQIQ